MYNEEIAKTNDNFTRYKERITNFSSEFEFGLFVYIAKKSIVWTILIMIVSLCLSFLYLRYTPPVYESSLTLQIGNKNTADKVLNVSNIYDKQDISAEIEMLRSKFLLNRAIQTLPLQVSYYDEGQFLTNELYTSCPFRVRYTILDSTIINTMIAIHFINDQEVVISFNDRGKAFNQKVDITEAIQLDKIILKIDVLNYQAIKETQDQVKQQHYLFKINNMDQLTNEYIARVNAVLLSNAAKTISISFRDNNPQKTVDISNALAKEFDKYDEETKSKSATKVLEFINDQLEVVYSRLKASESSIKTFKKNNKLPSVDNFSDLYLDKLNTLQDNTIDLDLQLNILTEIEKSVIEKGADIDIYTLLPILIGTEYETAISDLVNGLQNLLLKKEKMRFEVTADSKVISSIEHQINIQKKLILENVHGLKTKLESQRKGIYSKVEEIENKFFNIPEKEIEYARLQRLFSSDEKFFTLLLEKRTEYSISKAGFVPQNVILEKAVLPMTPISPDKKIILTTFLLGGISLSLILIMLRYLIHNDIISLNEITKHTHASIGILGIIPRYKKDIPVSQLVVNKNPKSLIAESFRTIRTNLQFISTKKGSKVMAITSTVSGEGKTFIAINLGGIIAFSGKKVIILDLDMRKPKIHSGFGVENLKGMSTLLIEKDSIASCVHNSEQENLDFITAGPIPPNPSELIINGKINVILDELKQTYDVIIIDTPPVGLVTDGINVIQKADYPIYIFRSEYSKKNFIQNVDRLFNENSLNRLSIILNGVDVSKNSYGYNYGYGYGYGYTYSTYGGYYDDSHRGESKLKKLFRKKRR
jgi:tyrosine-protein kinase Etk/Wzc